MPMSLRATLARMFAVTLLIPIAQGCNSEPPVVIQFPSGGPPPPAPQASKGPPAPKTGPTALSISQ
jgi:hypothetical protein